MGMAQSILSVAEDGFKYNGNGVFEVNIIDASYSFSRTVTGQFIEGGRPEVVLVVGDGLAPLILYEWIDGTWDRESAGG